MLIAHMGRVWGAREREVLARVGRGLALSPQLCPGEDEAGSRCSAEASRWGLVALRIIEGWFFS